VKTASGAFALALSFASPIFAQSPPFDAPPRPRSEAAVLPPHKVLSSVRSMGLDPVSPPALRGRVYVLRAYDASHFEKRVVVGARSGEVLLVQEAIAESPAFSPYGPRSGRYEPPRPPSIARATEPSHDFEPMLDEPLFPRQGRVPPAPSTPEQRSLATTSRTPLPRVQQAPPAGISQDAINTMPPPAPTVTAAIPLSTTLPTAAQAPATPAAPGKSVPAPHTTRTVSAPEAPAPSAPPADKPATQMVPVAPLE
jgi:hypothetical protein